MSKISFPLDVEMILKTIPNCRMMSYRDFAIINHCGIKDVIDLCESVSGCTHYDIETNRYLILYNDSTYNNNNIGRQLWTCAHEIGHIMCEHMIVLDRYMIAQNGFSNINKEFESEADFFAATLLCPFPICDELNIQSAAEVQKYFGLSAEAAQIRFKKYSEWGKSHLKTAWENDMRKLYRHYNCVDEG